MHVRVLREACCAQDDQMGSLEASYAVQPDDTFGELVAAIVASRFFQYSSSHVCLQGEVEAEPVVRVFSAFYREEQAPEFLVDAQRAAAEVVGAAPLHFRFVFD